jgi:hypothetical protein
MELSPSLELDCRSGSALASALKTTLSFSSVSLFSWMAYIAFNGEVLAEAAPAWPALEELTDRSSVIWLNGLNPVCSVGIVVKVHFTLSAFSVCPTNFGPAQGSANSQYRTPGDTADNL